MHSHSEGELWGLDLMADGTVTTSADDNQICVWDMKSRKLKKSSKLTDRAVAAKKGGASTLSTLSPSQCSRAVACKDGQIVAAGNDGMVTFDVFGNQ